jgi:hypothetical protein
MEFFNNTQIEDITDKSVDGFLRTDDPTMIESVPMCETFTLDGQLWIDFMPQLNRKYVAPIPDDAMVSRNEVDLAIGRYAIFLHARSPAGSMLKQLLEAKQKLTDELNS